LPGIPTQWMRPKVPARTPSIGGEEPCDNCLDAIVDCNSCAGIADLQANLVCLFVARLGQRAPSSFVRKRCTALGRSENNWGKGKCATGLRPKLRFLKRSHCSIWVQ